MQSIQISVFILKISLISLLVTWYHNLLVEKVPGLAVVIVGTDKDSQTYVSTKRKACAEAGIRSIDVDFPESISESELVDQVRQLNANPDVHGQFVLLFFICYRASIDHNTSGIY